jgi:GMP synthase-like glutamine amidotransferase
MPMRVLVIENYPNTTLGLVGEALAESGVDRHIVRIHAGASLASTHDGFDGLIMLGGAQDALDDANHPYLKDEAALARAFGEADKAVLGICLGAQILARAHGAKNILGRPIEFGWHEVRTTDAGRSDPVLSAMGRASPLFHWHLDTFTLPPRGDTSCNQRADRDAGLPYRSRLLRDAVPFRGRHEPRRRLDEGLRCRDRRYRSGVANAPFRRGSATRSGGGQGGAGAGARVDRADPAPLLKRAEAG